MISKKDLKEKNNFVFISTLKKFVGVRLKNYSKYDELVEIEQQKKIVLKNTISFANNQFFNNILLWGAKGMGKSSLIIAICHHLNSKRNDKIKILELLSSDVKYLPEILYKISTVNYKFIIFIDDITFNSNEADFKTFKVSVEGSFLSYSPNVAFYITSNIRNVINPRNDVNLNDIQVKDKRNNDIALADRFGLWVGFHKCDKNQYLNIVKNYAKNNKITIPEKTLEKEALKWSLDKGDFSGRIAKQFIFNINKSN
ncbi:ATP-binding protein [Rickettsiales bacterium]|nr:ATP-binding protein [Rickettsiales bacterium]